MAAMMPNVKVAKTPTNGDAKNARNLARKACRLSQVALGRDGSLNGSSLSDALRARLLASVGMPHHGLSIRSTKDLPYCGQY